LSATDHKRRFCLVLIKPSHYDDDGYVIQWLRSAIPSNSLAVLYGLALESAAQRVFGDNIDIQIHAWDETNTRIRPDRIASLIRGAGMVKTSSWRGGLNGVSSPTVRLI